MTVNEKYKEYKNDSVRVHLSCGSGGYDGTFSSEELKEFYGDCKCEDVYYEKDYGNDSPAIRHYLQIYTEKNYEKEIYEKRKQKRG